MKCDDVVAALEGTPREGQRVEAIEDHTYGRPPKVRLLRGHRGRVIALAGAIAHVAWDGDDLRWRPTWATSIRVVSEDDDVG